MRIIFVRHGHPDYEKDCLTELGHLQAEAAAERLKDEKIDYIYSSSCGRAVETAEHIAKSKGLEIELCDFMRELSWGAIDENDTYCGGSPWTVADRMIAGGENIMGQDWMHRRPFLGNKGLANSLKAGEEFDLLLEKLGYRREGDYYRVIRENNDNIAMVSHAGSSTAVFVHLFNMPLPFTYAAIRPKYTAITVVSFAGEEGKLILPQFEIANDSRHILNIDTENVFGN